MQYTVTLDIATDHYEEEIADAIDDALAANGIDVLDVSVERD